jgi:hypothetical protein
MCVTLRETAESGTDWRPFLETIPDETNRSEPAPCGTPTSGWFSQKWCVPYSTLALRAISECPWRRELTYWYRCTRARDRCLNFFFDFHLGAVLPSLFETSLGPKVAMLVLSRQRSLQFLNRRNSSQVNFDGSNHRGSQRGATIQESRVGR